MGLKWAHACVACGGLAAIAIGTWACSQGDPQPGTLPDPPTKDASSSGTIDAGGGDATKVVCAVDDGGCNTLQNCASKAYIVEVAQDASAPQGGTVLDGMYVLTDYRVFTGPGGTSQTTTAWFAETMTFVSAPVSDAGASDSGLDGALPQAMVWEDIVASNSSPQSSALSGVADFSGTSVTITHTCPNSNLFAGTFTMSNTQLLLYVQESTGVGQLTYTKQ